MPSANSSTWPGDGTKIRTGETSAQDRFEQHGAACGRQSSERMLVMRWTPFLFGRSAWRRPQLYSVSSRVAYRYARNSTVWCGWLRRGSAHAKDGPGARNEPFDASMIARRLFASDEAITLSIQLARWFLLLGTTHFPVSWGRTLTATRPRCRGAKLACFTHTLTAC